MAEEKKVIARLRGTGGGVWEFELPLDALHAELYANRKLEPADEESEAAMAAMYGLTDEDEAPAAKPERSRRKKKSDASDDDADDDADVDESQA